MTSIGQPFQHVVLQADTRGFTRAIAEAARGAHFLSVLFMRPPQRRRHVRRCHLCRPMANPRPLSIDGHAYRSRTRSRKGRR